MDLVKAFAAPGVATIAVPPGTYPPMALKGSGKTLVAEDMNNPPVFKRLKVQGTGIRLDGLVFDCAPLETDPYYTPIGLMLNSCSETDVVRCDFICERLDKGIGLRADDCTGLDVYECNSSTMFQHFNINRGRNITIERNSIDGVGENGISIAGCDGLVIRENYLKHFTAQGNAHPDAIQLWTARIADKWFPVNNVVIEGNTMLQGTGTGMQGIFHRSRVLVKAGEAVADELTRCKNWRITRNTVYQWGQWHGISLIEGVDNVSIVDNACLSPDDDTKRCWINLDACNGVSLVRNVADDYIGKSMPADWATWGNVKTAKVAAMISDLNARASASALRI
jgi:hypothetical protein